MKGSNKVQDSILSTAQSRNKNSTLCNKKERQRETYFSIRLISSKKSLFVSKTV